MRRRILHIADTLIADIPIDYKPKYPQVTILKDKDIQTIKSMYRRARYDGNHQIILSLSKKISELLEITPDERPMEFVEIIINDYNYFTQQ